MSLVSIIVPTLNQGQFIGDCLKSIQKQNHTQFEVIIQDAQSTDNTRSLCEEICSADPRFKYFCESDSGQSDAINKGLSRISGPYWTWLCSDDAFDSTDALSRLVKALSATDSSVCGVFGRANYIDENGQVIEMVPTLARELQFADFLQDWPLAQPAWLLKRDHNERVDVSLYLGMDLDLILRRTESASLRYVDVAVALVRVHKDSKSVASSLNAIVVSSMLILKYGGLSDLLQSAYMKNYYVHKTGQANPSWLRRRFLQLELVAKALNLRTKL